MRKPLELDPRASLTALLAAFAGKRVVVVGDLVADHYVYGETDRISREAPVLIVRYESAEVKLGGAGNAAANLRALGTKVTAVGLVGRDEMGARLRELCRKSSIQLLSPKAPGIETETKTRILAGGVNTRRQQMLRLDRGHRGLHPESVQQELANLLREAARDADAVLVSDYGAGVMGPPAIAAAQALAKSGVPVCVDSRYNLAGMTGLTLAKPNEPELEALTGMPTDSQAALLRAIKAAQKLVGARAPVMTRGRSGMVVAEKGRLEFIPPHGTKEAVDVTGAGDTVAATLTAALA
ncbi:MAG: bifunctional heptose 7-phosphate kinase/heptose 1-phosphate adenyltransferase, partial [Myxococcales bacterium]